MDLDALLAGQVGYLEIDIPGPDPDPDRVVALLREVQEVDLGLVVEADVVAAAEVDLGPSVGRPESVALGDGGVDDAFLVADVRRPLDERAPGEVAQAGHGIVRVGHLFLRLIGDLSRFGRLFLRRSLFLPHQGQAQGQAHYHGKSQDRAQPDRTFLVHGHSPRTLIIAKYMPRNPPYPPFYKGRINPSPSWVDSPLPL
jgi:hypothetical protein